jgi:AcrR family transcriptional regulator
MSAKPVKARLIDAAFALFEERGYERTTIDDITERAGVGRTTFFRTFRSKEDVIFPDHDVLLSALSTRLDGSTRQTALVAVTEAAHLVLRHYVAEGEIALARYRLIRSVPALREREIIGTQRYQRLFGDFLHRWMGGGEDSALRAELMAVAVVTAHNHVLRRWLRGHINDPEPEFHAAMTDVIDVFAGRDTTAGKPAVVVFQTTKDLGTVLTGLHRLLDDPDQPA